jgi:hypothetical protein
MKLSRISSPCCVSKIIRSRISFLLLLFLSGLLFSYLWCFLGDDLLWFFLLNSLCGSSWLGFLWSSSLGFLGGFNSMINVMCLLFLNVFGKNLVVFCLVFLGFLESVELCSLEELLSSDSLFSDKSLDLG